MGDNVPEEKNFKRIVRDRMAKTGESYATARAQLEGRIGPASPLPESETDIDIDIDVAIADAPASPLERLSRADAHRLGQHDIELEYAEAVLGFEPDLDLAEVIELAESDVPPDYLTGIRAASGTDLSVSEVVELNESELSYYMVRALRDVGVPPLTHAELLGLAQAGLDEDTLPTFVAGYAAGQRWAPVREPDATSSSGALQNLLQGDVTISEDVELTGVATGNVVVSDGGHFTLHGVATQDVRVGPGSSAVINGTVVQSVIVEQGATVEINGFVAGRVAQRGGHLTIRGVVEDLVEELTNGSATTVLAPGSLVNGVRH